MDFSDYDLYLTINGSSKHGSPRSEYSRTQEKWNEQNNGYGFALKKLEDDIVTTLMGGTYKNSLGKDSVYGAIGWQKRLFNSEMGHFDIGARLGGVTGYDYPVVPMAQGLATIGLGRNTDINIGYQPKVDGLTPEVWMLNADYKLK